jgi:hypothetical protein
MISMTGGSGSDTFVFAAVSERHYAGTCVCVSQPAHAHSKRFSFVMLVVTRNKSWNVHGSPAVGIRVSYRSLYGDARHLFRIAIAKRTALGLRMVARSSRDLAIAHGAELPAERD